MLLTAHPRELISTQPPLLRRQARKLKQALRDFHEDNEGMNTVEAIILLFVAAIVLLVFFALIWPLIRDKVMEQLNSLFSQTG